MLRNGYFAHQEYALIAMLGDYNKSVRNAGMAKLLARQKQVAEESANNNDCGHALNSNLICLFDVPMLTLQANAYYILADFDSYQQKPPAIASLTEMEECRRNLWYYTTYMS